jgi:hypothetical protein
MPPSIENPFRPGAGHTPPYLAGRTAETDEFKKLLAQSTILNNLVLTGLRGVGKTVLLDYLKPIAIREGWLWVGTDLSESVSISDSNLAIRLLADLATVTSSLVATTSEQFEIGFGASPLAVSKTLNYEALTAIYESTPGLASDRLKAVLETVWGVLQPRNKRGIIFAYDEAQNLTDHADRSQFPLSLLLEVFQSIQKRNIPFMLALSGLPNLLANLVEARTYAERMFHVLFLQRLSEDESREAIVRPTEATAVSFLPSSVEQIIELSGGYPYFIQFICREVFDICIQKMGLGENPRVPVGEIVRKLDTDFFAGRWAKATDRQRQLLYCAATLEGAGAEFTVQDLVTRTKQMLKLPFTPSHANQMLKALGEKSLIYKGRHGKYSFAVPLLHEFILRQSAPEGLLSIEEQGG